MSAHLLSTALALPQYAHTQQEIGAALQAWLAHDPAQASRTAAILAHGEVRRRYTVRPLDWYVSHTSVTERSRVYQEQMLALGEAAARRALDEAGVRPDQVGLIISTSCTGVMIPSVDSYLIERLGCAPGTRRLPLTELGCVAGAAALSQADLYLRVFPGQAVLVLAAELASLTAQVGDFSMANIVSAALFGDGAAATVAVGPDLAQRLPPSQSWPDRRPARIVASRSVNFPGTPELMGFDNTDTGLKIILSPRVPRFIRQHLPQALAPFLEQHGLRRSDLKHFLLHPGGRKVLEGLEQELRLTREDTRLSWLVLGEYGNLSSATVLFILHHFEREARPQPGDYGLLLAVGPGFCAELVLLQW